MFHCRGLHPSRDEHSLQVLPMREREGRRVCTRQPNEHTQSIIQLNTSFLQLLITFLHNIQLAYKVPHAVQCAKLLQSKAFRYNSTE